MLVEHATADVLVLGAGPYGLAVAIASKRAGRKPLVVGSPLALWRSLPQSMHLRTKLTARFDPLGTGDFGQYLAARGIAEDPSVSIPRELFVRYAQWVLDRERLRIVDAVVTDLSQEEGTFVTRLAGGEVLRAPHAVIATGAAAHAYVPNELVDTGIPARHSLFVTDYASLRGTHVCVVGGRQSAFEAAVLAAEAGAARVSIVFPHETPRFAPSDWSFLKEEIARVRARRHFGALSAGERQAVIDAFDREGRHTLEPALAMRIEHPAIHIYEHTDAKEFLQSDVPATVISATGFQPHIQKVSCIAPSLLSGIAHAGGLPVLSSGFESSVPGLFVAGILATGSFGPLLEYMHGCAAAAEVIAEEIAK